MSLILTESIEERDTDLSWVQVRKKRRTRLCWWDRRSG